ncbi:MAG: 4-vinyl reductase [Thermofilaceae archaeon]
MKNEKRRIVPTPYEVGRYAFVPGTVPFVFYIRFQPEALTEVGILDKLINILVEKGIPILLLKVSAAKAGEALTALLIADLKGRERMIEDIVQRMKRVPYVAEVLHAPPIIDGVVIDPFSFPLRMIGERAVILRRPVYEGMIKEGWTRFGTPYAILLYTVGYGAGLLAYKEHSKIVSKPNIQKLAEALFQAVGFGRLEIVKLDDERREAVFRVYDSFECELFQGAGEIRGNFIRGLIAGWLAGYWGVTGEFEVVAREMRCIAKGDPYCEYVARVERKAV